jgi:hypothetical protein
VMPAKARPLQPDGEALRWLGDCQEQAPNLWHGQGEEVGWPPFSSAVAW